MVVQGCGISISTGFMPVTGGGIYNSIQKRESIPNSWIEAACVRLPAKYYKRTLKGRHD